MREGAKRRLATREAPRLSSVDRQRLGQHILALRLAAGLTQSELGGGIYGRSAVSRIEAGAFVPSLDALFTFAQALGVPFPEIVPEDF